MMPHATEVPMPMILTTRITTAALSAALTLTTLGALGLAACTSDDAKDSYPFGPFQIAAHEEQISSCVQISLHNTDPMYVNAVELTTGPGFHHSNWFFVPESVFFGDDGTFRCNDRDYNEATAALFGGVLFAQSTQAPHEIQAFPPGVAIRIPPNAKIVAQVHLLNPGEDALHLTPTIKLTPIPQAEVVTLLSGISFADQALGLPGHQQSRFSVECDLAPLHNQRFQRDPDFKIYYGLAHYHTLGTSLTLEAIKPDGTAATVFTTSHRAGDTLGGPIDPLFDMTGYTKLRMSCNFYNPRDTTVGWGIGDQEMCVFLAFSDSPANWGGGAVDDDAPGDPTIVDNGVMSYTHACTVFEIDAQR
jgi:hypothetical protein